MTICSSILRHLIGSNSVFRDNAQAGVETTSRLIVGTRVAEAPNDKQQLVPTLGAVMEHVSPGHVLVDRGFVSEAAVTRVERETPGLRVLAALIREPRGRTVAQLEKRDDPPESAPDATFAERMGRRTATAAGRALYKLRQQTVEPVFVIIKEAMGFRRFSLRGHKKVSLESDLVCLACNVKRLHRLGAAPGGNRSGPVRTKPVVPRLREQIAVSGSDQNGSVRVFAGLQPVKIRFSAFLSRQKLSLTARRTRFLLPGLFLSPTGC